MSKQRGEYTKELLKKMNLKNVAKACDIERQSFMQVNWIKDNYKKKWIMEGLKTECKNIRYLEEAEKKIIDNDILEDIKNYDIELYKKTKRYSQKTGGERGQILLVHADPRYVADQKIAIYSDYIESTKKESVVVNLKENKVIIGTEGTENDAVDMYRMRETINAKIKNETGSKPSSSLVEILTAVTIITMMNINEVIVHCGYYGYNCEYVVAGKILKVKTIEIQHGALYDYEGVAYNFREDLSHDPRRRILYPDELLIWGEYWKRQISGHIDCRVENIREKYIKSIRALNKPKKRSIDILIANRIDDRFYKNEVSRIRQISDGMIEIRLHPWIWRDRKDYIEELKKEYIDERIRVVDENLDLIESLKKAKKVYSPKSTIIFECFALGIETQRLGSITDVEQLTFEDFKARKMWDVFKGVGD